METYKCGHPKKEIIINTNAYTLSIYMEWDNSESNICFECWIKNRNK